MTTYSGRRFGGVGLFLAAQVVWVAAAHAAGAVAVGVAPGGAQKGFSYGLNSNQANDADAQASALNGCRTSKESNKQAQARCVLIGTYTDQCATIAMDPKAGTPGVGWAVAADTATANKLALASCEATAGPGREGTCKVFSTRCDGTAK
jgi:hypothetical protein